MKSKTYPVSRKNDLVIQELDGEVLIYDLSENKAFCLNETSALVWEACDGTKSVNEISKLVSQQLNSSANEDLIWFAIDQLKKEKLIENSDELPNNFAGMSRREVIKKVGLGSMIALPLVATMVAPVSAQVRSCTQPGGIYSAPLGTPTNCGNATINAACSLTGANQCCSMTFAPGTAANCSIANGTVDCTCA